MATFGFEGQGGTANDYDGTLKGTVFASGGVGTLSKLSVLVKTTAARKFKVAIYKHSDLSLKDWTAEQNANTGGVATWFDLDPVNHVAIENTDYLLVCWGNSPDVVGYYDAAGATDGHYQTLAYDGFPDPFVPTHIARKYSIHADYTPAGGLSIPVAMHHLSQHVYGSGEADGVIP